MLEIINQHVVKIALALHEGDSVLQVAKKTGSSYGWVHKWIEKLEEIGAVKRGDGIEINDETLLKKFRDIAKSVISRKLELKDAYLLPNFSGMNYAYTKTDAVYIWTKGGYQIGRSRRNYPIFIKVLKEDLEEWKKFLRSFSIDYSIGKRDGDNIYFVLFPEDSFETEWVENASVEPLQEAVDWARKYEANFLPALEILGKMYGIDLDVEYSERKMIK